MISMDNFVPSLVQNSTKCSPFETEIIEISLINMSQFEIKWCYLEVRFIFMSWPIK